MASYRPFPPPPPNQNPHPHPHPPPPSYPHHHNPYFPSTAPPSNYTRNPSNPTSHYQYNHHDNPLHHYPPSSSAFPPPPPMQPHPFPPPPPTSHQTHTSYFPSSQFSSQYDPPLPTHSLPPPPPLPAAPPPQKQSIPLSPTHRPTAKETVPSEPSSHAKPPSSLPLKQPKAPPAAKPAPAPAPAPTGKVETEEERRARKKREYENMRQQEKRQQVMKQTVKQTQATVLQKTQKLSHGGARTSLTGSRMAERRTTSFLSADRVENRLKKPTTFICKLKFRNDLPDPTAQPKLLPMNTDRDRYTRYAITSLEKMQKPKLYPEHDLGIPLDLLDLSVYKTPAVCPPLAPEDEELLRDGEIATPVKQDGGGIRKKDRPTDKGVSWLVKTQYISPLSMDSAKLSLTEKQAKEMRENKEGRNLFLENLNNREKQIQAIEESFEAAKLPPVHQTNHKLTPTKILPLLPDFDRYDDQFVMVTFDGVPTADSETFSKLTEQDRDKQEAQAIMKSFVVNGSDPTKAEKFLAYMVPATDKLSKDRDEENEDIIYSWIREYHWDVRGDDAGDPSTYLVNLDNDVARYLPLPTKLVLQKKRAKEGRSSDEIEHYPVPSRVTVRRAPVTVKEPSEYGGMSSAHDKVRSPNPKRGRSLAEVETWNKHSRVNDRDHYSGEEDMSE